MKTKIETILMDFILNHIVTGHGGLVLNYDDDLLGSGFINSLSFLQLIRYVETEFGLEIPNRDITIDNFSSIQSIAAYIRRQKGKGNDEE